jgi:hypothetical protein
MKKTLVCMVLSLTFILSTTAAVFAVDDVGAQVIVKDNKIVEPMRVDDVGPQ